MSIRARDLGLPFLGKTGKYNAITDVPGVEVGTLTLLEGEGAVEIGKGPVRTGVTAILPKGKCDKPSYIWAGQHNLNGNGEMTGTHWINEAGYFLSPICITNTHSVGIVHHATVKWMIDQYQQHFHNHHNFAMPVIAETYDGVLNDICGLHIKEEHVLAALNNAKSGAVQEGNVGGGTGMMTYEFKGGTGSSSRSINIAGSDFTVGVLVQSNFGARDDFHVLGVPVGLELAEDKVYEKLRQKELGSIIVIIATDIPLNSLQLKRMAKRASMGLARTGSIGGHGSGDIFLAFSTANDITLKSPDEQPDTFHQFDILNDELFIDTVYRNTVHAVEESIINAVVAGNTLSSVKPAGFDVKAIDHDKLIAVMRKYNRIV